VTERLLQALLVQTVGDFKAVSFFSIDSDNIPGIQNALVTAKVDSSPLVDAFPLACPASDLENDDGKHKLVATFSDQFGVGVVLSRKRVFTLREEYDRDRFTDAMRQQFPSHDKIIALKNYVRQTFDVVYLNLERGVLELRSDITRSDELFQTVQQLDVTNRELKGFASVFLYNALRKQVFDSPHNLFPVIKRVYEDPSGAIKKLGFSTATNSVKNETMRGGVDLRSELFHKYGAQAINHQMSLFEIAIVWHRKDIDGFDSKPELHIPGTYKESASISPRSDFAIVKGVRDSSDSDFILGKLLSFEK